MSTSLRTTCFSSFFIFLILLIYTIWPWFHAGYMWRQSTIEASIFFSSSLSNNETNPVPRIIHQTYRDIHSIPLKWQKASNSCRTLHSDYKYYLWTDEQGRLLIEKEFPCLLSTFDSYPYDIQRADVIRLVALYVHGGIYLDLDIVCLTSLDRLLKYEFILPKTKPVGLSNDVIISKPKHPFLFKILHELSKFNQNYFTKYPTVMFSTGPMFLTKQASSYVNRSSLDILSSELYGKYSTNSSYALFRHLKASSWHGNDASIIKLIYRWRYMVLAAVTIVLMMIFILIYFIQQYNFTIKITYHIYLAIWLTFNSSTLKEPTLIHNKYVRISL
ncbi:unnamed protein product [Rotaria socialis]|uniref:Glycosyltransferase n=1 Tax=Rotaria socialis TaxID=392032 RepID=A0A818K483_9BILA|nr:unnamed protein product [Rotaria socialis]